MDRVEITKYEILVEDRDYGNNTSRVLELNDDSGVWHTNSEIEENSYRGCYVTRHNRNFESETIPATQSAINAGLFHAILNLNSRLKQGL